MSDCNCDPKGGILALILALVMALSLVACGGGNEGGDKDGEKLKIALVLPGKKDDVSFAVTHIDEDRSVAVGIITRIIKQHL